MAARLRGTLQEIEEAVLAAEEGPSLETVADKLRPDIQLPGALKWLRRRKMATTSALVVAVTSVQTLSGCEAKLASIRKRMGTASALVKLRRLCSKQLPQIVVPVGFRHCNLRKRKSRNDLQHKTGTDPPSPSG